jgi:hypothetical protein
MTKTKNKLNTSVGLTGRLRKLEAYVNTHKGDVKYKINWNQATPTLAGSIFLVSGIQEGDGPSERAGNAINLQSVDHRIAFRMTTSCNVRVLLIRDRINTGGALPGIVDVLHSADVNSTTDYNNFILQKRFVLLDDVTYHFTTGGILYNTYDKHIKQQTKLRWQTSGNGISDTLSNQILALVITDTASAGTVEVYDRLLYTDE